MQTLGPEGGKVCLPDEPRCRATFPKGAVHKKIKVALQVEMEFFTALDVLFMTKLFSFSGNSASLREGIHNKVLFLVV